MLEDITVKVYIMNYILTISLEKHHEHECPHTVVCSFCFLDPCVTHRSYSWLGDGQDAHKNNNSFRKERYKKYWKVIANCGGWNHSRYLQKKSSVSPADEGTEVWHKQEIMAECMCC